MKRVGKLKTPSLVQVTGERPTCQRCFKPLAPVTGDFEMPGHLHHIPTAAEVRAHAEATPNGTAYFAEIAVKEGYDPSRVYRLWHHTNWKGQPVSQVFYWRGFYAGRGFGKDRAAPLFCNPECALGFAALCWDAGMRIVRKDET